MLQTSSSVELSNATEHDLHGCSVGKFTTMISLGKRQLTRMLSQMLPDMHHAKRRIVGQDRRVKKHPALSRLSRDSANPFGSHCLRTQLCKRCALHKHRSVVEHACNWQKWSSWESNPEPSPLRRTHKSNAKKMSYH